ncbi:glycosyltransferase family 32 protein [Gilvibacter sediminis]|uniref:glycosyltransferase family 32 protein n=1 Tax=Gilvibacter sediminis TaxID=379071 RepID=UPI0023503FE1|nr:glycosyltransferase [Gilvibacter sediminis]MDC7999260.1 glycosyltransferase [Gilvibacter sediminis]
MSIPKIIHCCWFGGAPLSSLAEQCQDSWRAHAPDFTIKTWNEANSEKYQNQFYKDAIREGQYAFASDAIRVAVLEAEGGIYLDMDMLLVKPLESLLSNKFFTGYEVEGRPAYGIFGGVAGHRFFKAMNHYYNTQRFNRYSPPVITHTFKELIKPNVLASGEIIYDIDYFYALSYEDRDKAYESFLTDRSIAVHLWDHSWKQAPAQSVAWLLEQLWAVHMDRWMRGYPKAYFKRYRKEFARKLFHKINGKA